MFLGHKENWNRLQTEFTNGRIPNAYLFYGIPGIGKKLFAQTLVQWYFCLEKKEVPCGKCAACERIEKHAHPDFYFLSSDEGQLKADGLRQMARQLYKSPLEAPIKAVLIDDAHDMTVQAANSLLKILEEPPANTLFILTAPNLFRILPTIRSRCRKLFFQAPSLEEGQAFLAQKTQLEPQMIRNLLHGFDGSLGLSLKVTETGFTDSLAQFQQMVKSAKVPFSQVVSTVEEMVAQKVDLSLILEVLKKECVRESVSDPASGNFHLKRFDSFSKAQRDIDRNLNKALVLENLILELAS